MVINMRKCPNCGEELQEHDRVCRNCGAFLDVVQTDEASQEDDFPIKEVFSDQDFLNIPSYSEISATQSTAKPKKTFYWKPPILFLILGIIFIISFVITKYLAPTQEIIIKIETLAGISSFGISLVAFIIVIIFYISKKEFHYTMTPREIIDSNASPVEQRRMAYVGKNYVKISKKKFSFAAFFFNWYYLLYRKRYLIAIPGMLLIIALAIAARYLPMMKYAIIAIMVIVSILLGFFFNKYYIKFINKKTKSLKDKNSNLDVETFLKLCQKKGTTSFFTATIIYVIFLMIIVLITSLSITKVDSSSKKEEPQEELDVKVKVIDREYQKKRSQCKSYAEAVYKSYLSANLEVNYIGCHMGKDQYVILRAKNPTDQSTYIAKYKINKKQEELKLVNTTLEIDDLRQKQQSQTITSEEAKTLKEKETIEEEFNTFDTKISEDKTTYKKDETYVRNYIKIKIDTLT